MKRILFSLLLGLCYPFAVFAQHDGMNMSMPAPKTAKADTLPAKKAMNHKEHQMKSIQTKRPTQTDKGKIVEYHLYVSDTTVNFTGDNVDALCINGQIPAPTLFFTEGDTAVIRVHNEMDEETSVHWHGILLSNEQDGVPYLTTAPIEPGKTHTFTFPLIQSGTYWYHSHTMLQEQSGLYGSIVIYPKQFEKSKEYVLVLSDWTDSNPHEVLRSLKRATDWYAIKKGAVQSFGEAIQAGYLKDKLKQEWMRMPPMDVSDVYYDKFLMNGKAEDYFRDVKPNEAIRLRIINGSASTYFTLQYAGGQMQVIAADGLDVSPLKVDRLEIAVAETYDVLITAPQRGAAELRATSWDIMGYASAFFGNGEVKNAPTLPVLNYFEMMRQMNSMDDMSGMDMPGGKDTSASMTGNGGMKLHDMSGMDMTNKRDTAHSTGNMGGMDTTGESGGGTMLNYDMLRSPTPTTLDPKNNVREVHLSLTGNMLRYIWSFDNTPLSAAAKILIHRGENVRFIFHNNTMMRHPLHLHGHLFRLVNKQGDHSPLKHTFDIRPMETVTIEFYANEEKDWFFHCHILYHMMSGMARIISYEETSPEPITSNKYKPLVSEDATIYSYGSAAVHSQGTWGYVSFSNNNYLFEVIGRVNWKGDYETETHLARYIDAQQFLSVYVGSDVRKTKSIGNEKNTKDNRQAFEAGVMYLLPFFLQSELRIDATARVRFQVSRSDMPFTSRLRFDWLVNTDKEYSLGLRYILTRNISLSTNYDSDYKLGGGLTFTY
jgi:CopA family copper-resistance protein